MEYEVHSLIANTNWRANCRATTPDHFRYGRTIYASVNRPADYLRGRTIYAVTPAHGPIKLVAVYYTVLSYSLDS